MVKYDFSGWATRNDLLCGDGRTIRKNAFKDNDGKTVPLIWNHDHGNPEAVLGHAVLEHRDDGVYAYGKFNDTEQGKNAKMLVEHGDVRSLSICANKLKQIGKDVMHGCITELSLVLAGANPGAFIDYVMAHSDDEEDSIIANYDENAIMIYHSDDEQDLEHADDKSDSKDESKEDAKVEDEKKTEDGETIADIYNSMSEKQQTAVHAIVGAIIEQGLDNDDDENEENIKHSEGGNEIMKANVFDQGENQQGRVLTHADEMEIIKLAKTSGVGSLQRAIAEYCETNEIKHGVDELETLFPEFKNLNPGAPDLLTRDQGWVTKVMNGVSKSPFSRVRTRQADARIAALRAKGYKKGEEKTIMANIKLLGRQVEPQTVYIKDELNRDDIVDITDFSIIDYEKKVMKMTMNEEVATAIMIGDGREDGDPDKIHEDRIIPIWKDEDLYTIKASINFAAEKAELQGTNTAANFSDNYVYAEAMVKALLYARENYKASGELEMYCEPHIVNVMLLARDLNGHRLYKTRADLAAALDVKSINTAEQFAGKTRTDKDGKTKKLLALFVNLNNYQVGATRGGEITTFDQFDIDFNKQKFLMEARCSGALTEPYSAIAIEEEVAAG